MGVIIRTWLGAHPFMTAGVTTVVHVARPGGVLLGAHHTQSHEAHINVCATFLLVLRIELRKPGLETQTIPLYHSD